MSGVIVFVAFFAFIAIAAVLMIAVARRLDEKRRNALRAVAEANDMHYDPDRDDAL